MAFSRWAENLGLCPWPPVLAGVIPYLSDYIFSWMAFSRRAEILGLCPLPPVVLGGGFLVDLFGYG